jgi:Peptidase family M41
MAAEEIWFGDTTGGPGSDLANATYRAAVMLGFLGMGDSLIAYSLLGDNPYTGGSIQAILEDPKNREAIRNLLTECKHDAVELLRRNEPAIRALAERLLERDEVQGEEIEEIMAAKGVARATPAFKPVLELLGQDWHQPALVEARPSFSGPRGDGGSDGGLPSTPTTERHAPPAQPPAGEPTIRRSTSSHREFEW